MRIPFWVENGLDVSHPGWTVNGGIPLPRGAVAKGTRFGVEDTSGRPVPAQVNVTGYWPDGSVKWVLLLMTVPVAVGKTEFAMVETAGASPPAIANEDANAIRVNTGRIEFCVSKRDANVFQRLGVLRNGKSVPVLESPGAAGWFVEMVRKTERREETIRFEAGRDRNQFSATLEEAGNERTVICLRGTHVSQNGERFCPYTIRLYARAGSGTVRMVHSLVYDGHPQEEFIRSIGVRIRPTAEWVDSYALGTEHGAGIETPHPRDPGAPQWNFAGLFQNGSEEFRMAKWIDRDRNAPVQMCVGRRARGWGWISTGRIAVTAGIRNFWQEYPKAITVDAAAGEMTAYLYSPWGPALDLRRYSDWLYPDHYESGAASDGIPEKFDHEREGARYIGKTSEIFLTFGEAGTPAGEVARDWLFFQDPPMLTAGAEQIARTRVFGRFTATDKEDPRAGANHYRQCIDFIVNEPDYRKWYSFINYGDVVHSFDPDRDAWRSDQGGYGWCNNESQMCEGLWTGFLATGDRRLFRLAEAMTRHISDVDMYQMGPATGRASRHNVSHWGCRNKERRKTIPEHKRIYYFLTGDEHTRDQVRLIYDAIVRDTEWIGGAMDFAVAATAMLFFWETTGRDAWGTRLKTACEAYCARRIKERGFVHQIDMDYATGKGTIPDSARSLEGFFLMDFGPMQILLAAAELTGSTIVHQAILDWAELLHLEPAQRAQYQTCFQVGRLGDTTSMRTAAYACEHTGDRRYMEYIRRGLEHPILAFETIGGNGPLEPAAHLVPRIYPETGKEWERLKEFQLGDSRVSFLWNLKGKYISGEVGHALWLARTLANFPYGWSVESM